MTVGDVDAHGRDVRMRGRDTGVRTGALYASGMLYGDIGGESIPGTVYVRV